MTFGNKLYWCSLISILCAIAVMVGLAMVIF